MHKLIYINTNIPYPMDKHIVQKGEARAAECKLQYTRGKYEY